MKLFAEIEPDSLSGGGGGNRYAPPPSASSGAGCGCGPLDFLGFTHICGKSRTGRFWLWRTTTKRMRAKLREVNDQLKLRRHQPIPEQGQWLGSVARGYFAYYAVPGNSDALKAFRTEVTRHWHKSLRRRSQRTHLNWVRMNRIATRWLPRVRVMCPFPEERFDARTRGRSPVR